MRKPLKFLVYSFFATGLLSASQAGYAVETERPDRAALWLAAVPAQGEEAKTFIQTMGDEVIHYIVDTNLSQTEKEARLEDVLKENFDLYTISRFTLGRYWQQLSSAQQEEYRRLLEDLVVSIYSQKFANYQGQKFEVTGVRPSGKDDFIVSSMILQPDAKDIPVGWHIRRENGQFRIVDVTVEKVSMIVTQKSDFASIIQRQGGDPAIILDHLRQRLGHEAG